MLYPRLRYHNKRGWLSASDALLMCFYIPHPNERIAPAIIRAVELLRERIRPYQFAWNDTGDGQAEPLDDASWERTRRKTLEAKPGGSGSLMLEGKPWRVDDLLVDYRGLSPVPLPWPERKDDVCVHWMNFLGQPVLGKLGGVSSLRERLSLQELSGDRVLITLGDSPEVGDVEAGQTLPLHRALARILEPYLYQRSSRFGHPTAPEHLLRWDRRFLD